MLQINTLGTGEFSSNENLERKGFSALGVFVARMPANLVSRQPLSAALLFVHIQVEPRLRVGLPILVPAEY